MELYLTGFIVTYLCALISLDKYLPEKIGKYLSVFLFFSLLVFCSMRGGIDRDHQSYINIYGYILNGTNYLIEPTFYFFTYISHFFLESSLLLFLLYAFIACSLKFYIFRKYCIFPVVSILVYYCNYYFLHEMTQIRVGVSIALAIIGINFWVQGYKKYFWPFLFLSFLFHFSALVFLIVPFVPLRRIRNKELLVYLTIILISYFLFFVKFGLAKFFSYIPIGFVQEKFIAYSQKASLGNVEAVNVFSSLQLIKISVIFLVHFFVPRNLKNNSFFNIMFRFYIYSCICWVMFFDIPAFAIRLSELFGFAEVFILPYLLFVSRKKIVGVLILSIICFFVFYVSIYHNQLLLPYQVFWE